MNKKNYTFVIGKILFEISFYNTKQLRQKPI